MIERYSRPELRQIWSDEFRYETWLQVELAACRAMETEGTVPVGTADYVQKRAIVQPKEILRIEATVRHDVIAFLTHIENQVGEKARWLHFGLTSSDVLDTAFALQLKKASFVIRSQLEAVCAACREKALETRDVPMVGRTHGIHAEPTAVGLVFVAAFSEFSRHLLRFDAAVEALSVGKLSGAVGVYGNASPATEAAALQSLGLAAEPCATQVVPRDRHAAFFQALALIASSVERLAVQVRHWQRTEVGEAYEPFGKGQKGSSAMPHKMNPILSENLCGLARLVRGYASASLESVALWHERDISHSSVERVIGPDATVLVDFMLARLTEIIQGLTLRPERLNANLACTRGLIFSGAVLLALVKKGMPRQKAYGRVQACALALQESGKGFAELLGADKEIAAQLNASELAECFDLGHHLRYVDAIYARVLGPEATSA